MTTPVHVPTVEAPDMETTYSLKVTDRCDRCGAQAFVVTSHAGRLLLWCAHHYREHEKKLRAHKVLDLRATINREASISTTPS